MSRKSADPEALGSLRNVGPATAADFAALGVTRVSELARADADALYLSLWERTGARPDPCVHDTFAAAIHQAKTGEARDWWSFTAARKARQRAGSFPFPPASPPFAAPRQGL